MVGRVLVVDASLMCVFVDEVTLVVGGVVIMLVLGGSHSACSCCCNGVNCCGRSDPGAGGYGAGSWW